MKRILAVILMLAVMAIPVCNAEEEVVFNGFELMADETVTCDLDGDGADELLVWGVMADEEMYTEEVILEVENADGMIMWTQSLYSARVYVCDIDMDGVTEIFVSGDFMSDDYATYCLHYTADGFVELPFADANRGENTDDYYECGYGMITSMAEGQLVLNGSQDVLGTYFGSRVFGLQNGVFELVDDGLWRFDWDVNDPEVWQYVSLNPLMNIAATFFGDEGEYEGVISAGERFLITASDKVSIVYFALEDGRTGYFRIEPDAENWGSLVNGVPESIVFEYVPYAD